jgi:Tfp pilus assembly protein PilF
LIDSNPASTDAYRLFAKLAFDVGQNDDAVTMLRSAIAIAPRENVSRIMLARHLVKKRQIDAAIELYWQATGQFKRANVILRQLLVEHPDDTLFRERKCSSRDHSIRIAKDEIQTDQVADDALAKIGR